MFKENYQKVAIFTVLLGMSLTIGSYQQVLAVSQSCVDANFGCQNELGIPKKGDNEGNEAQVPGMEGTNRNKVNVNIIP